jgi:DNA-binding MarR family transcriptional regulator
VSTSLHSTTQPHRANLIDPKSMRDVLPYQANQLLARSGAPVLRWCEGQFGITRRQWRLLAALMETDSIRSSDLAEKIELDRVRTSRAMQEMEQNGLLARQAETGNARYVRVSITEQGRALYEALWPMVRAHHLRLMDVLSAQEKAQFEDILARLQSRALELRDSYDNLPKANRQAGRSAAATRASVKISK